MGKAEKYQRFAEECMELARTAKDAQAKADPLPPSAIQSSCVAVFLFDQLVRAQQDRYRGQAPWRSSILSTVSYFTDNCTGRSAGFSLLRMRST